MNKPTEQQFNVGVSGPEFTGKVIISGVEFNADSMERIHACLAACEGISTEQLAAVTVAQMVAAAVLQRDELLAMLVRVAEAEFGFGGPWPEEHELCAMIAKYKGDLPQLTATGGAHEGASNANTAFVKKMLADEPAPRYTSVSKGGSYERLGAIRGAGSLKGLSGIAYRDTKGNLFIREPECFAKRMVLIKAEGGAQ